ncbi:MAG: glycosyl hydrolase family protein, partial [Candidatus Aminicenantes bacterium]
YTSARIVTRNRYEPTYGRIEARIKLPTGQGLWPAFWLLGNDIGTVGWPQCGEIDIMEYRGQEPATLFGTLHGPGYSGGAGISQTYVLENDRFDTAFHTFAVEWEVGVIRWYVDDVLYHTVVPSDLNGNEWVFDHPFYIILNVAVGGNFVGPPDPSTVFPQTMRVDYVRVYSGGAAGDSCCILRGDVNDNGTITSADIIALVNYVFKGGPASVCTDHGDVNDNATITSSDIIALVNYVFKGGAAPAECPVSATVPSGPAPTPTIQPGDVVSLFSDAYTNVPVTTWSADWDEADVEDYLIGSDSTKKFTNLVFSGTEFLAPTVDASAMTHFHMDVWTPDPTDAPAVFKVKLVDFGANGVWDGGVDDVEHEIWLDENTMNTGSWVSLEIPLADFTGLITRAHLAQLLLSGDPDTVYVDNIYFHR